MLRHSKQDLQMCRKPVGSSYGFVCHQHEGRCIVCDLQFDEVLDTMRMVLLCDECGLVPDGEERCVMCGSNRATEVALYCQYCTALEKDRDGCPRILNQSRQQRLAAMKKGMSKPAA